jgi:hypothetical protein
MEYDLTFEFVFIILLPLQSRGPFYLKFKYKNKEMGPCFSLFFNQIKIKKAGGTK